MLTILFTLLAIGSVAAGAYLAMEVRDQIRAGDYGNAAGTAIMCLFVAIQHGVFILAGILL